MAQMEMRDVASVILAFTDQTGGEQFAISNRSLEILADYALRRLDDDPNSLPSLLEEVQSAREDALRAARAAGDLVRLNGTLMPIISEVRAKEMLKDCFDNYPPL